MTALALGVCELSVEELKTDEIDQVSGGGWQVPVAMFVCSALFGGPAGDFANGFLDGLSGR
jgi:hypothetical protein